MTGRSHIQRAACRPKVGNRCEESTRSRLLRKNPAHVATIASQEITPTSLALIPTSVRLCSHISDQMLAGQSFLKPLTIGKHTELNRTVLRRVLLSRFLGKPAWKGIAHGMRNEMRIADLKRLAKA